MMLGYVSRKTKTLLNLTKQQNDDDYNIIDKIHLYVLKMKNWRICLKHNKDPKGFIKYPDNMQYI